MIIINATRRLLKPISKQTSLLKKYNKNIFCTLNVYNKTINNAYQVQKIIKQQRRFCVLSESNIVKSPFPDKEIPETLLTDYFWSKAEKWSDLTALVCGITDREMTYKQLRLLSRRLATSLLKEGFKPGDVIAVLLPNMPEFPVVALGILEAGLVVTTINPLYTADEIAYQIKNSQAVAIVTIPEKLETVIEAKSNLKNENKDYTLRLICTNDVFGSEPDILPSSVERYSSLIADDVDDSQLSSLQTQARTTHDIAFIPFSSGTTGKPKGVCLTHRNLVSNLIALFEDKALQYPSNGRQEIMPFIIPGFHIYGFTGGLLHTLSFGAKLVTLPKFNEDIFLKVLEQHKFTVLYTVPPLVIYISTNSKVTKDHLKSVKLITNGAAPIAISDVMKCLKKSTKLQFKQGYGLTETSPTICTTLEDKNKYNSVGPLVANTIAKVACLRTNQALPPYEEGEICIKGPQVMKGYLNNKKATAEVFDSEGWFHTGDIGYYDNDGDFYITDRLKELIKVKGFQVAPAELEGILRSHPEVEEAGVIGVPDKRKGERPVGFVQLKQNSKVTNKDLKAFLENKVTNYKLIDTFVFVDSIPRSGSGKILRKDLKQIYLKKNLDVKNL